MTPTAHTSPAVSKSFRFTLNHLGLAYSSVPITEDVVDLVLMWWREGDGDLVDALVDAIGPLAENGVIWVLTPKTGKPGHVEPSEIAEAAPTAGLSQTSNATVSDGWAGARLVAPKAAKSKR